MWLYLAINKQKAAATRRLNGEMTLHMHWLCGTIMVINAMAAWHQRKQ